MSLNPSYSHSAVALAKVKIGESVLWLKDADLRAVVEAFGTATAKDSTDAVTSSGVALPTESAIYDFVLSQIGGLGKVLTLLSESNHSAVVSPKQGDVVVEADGKEWLYDGEAWREVGDENIYALKSTEIAGLSLESSISAAALSSALRLDALAFKASASGPLSNYVNGIEDIDYTPSGEVSVVPETATFNEVASVGKLPSLSDTTGTFATAGITAALDSEDTEMLVFTNAGTASALTAYTFNAGELPSLASSATTFVTGISAASFTGTSSTITPVLTSTTKEVSVS